MGRRRRRSVAQRLLQVLLALLLLAGLWLAERVSDSLGGGGDADAGLPADARGPCGVRKVVDGDTVRLRCGGEELVVRLLRIDTPEREEPGYLEATRALRALLAGHDVWLAYEEPGVPARGNYGRVLAYLFAGGSNVNVEMVRAGHSPFDTRWGKGRFARAFRAAEREGRL